MGCKIFITMLTVCIFQFQYGLKALPIESAAPVVPCTLQEATEINQKHLQDSENRLNNINVDTDGTLNNVNEQIEKVLAERTAAGQELFAGLQTTLNQEILSKPESVACLSAVQIQIDFASAKSSFSLAKCSTKTQKKSLQLKSKILKVQQKVQSIQNKAVTSIGKCAIRYYPYGSCADLDACCEVEKTKSLMKVDKYVNKIKYSAEKIVMNVDKCLTEAIEDTQKYILYINFNILNCSAAQPIIPGPNSGESAEVTNAPEVAITEGTGNTQDDIETVAPQNPSTEEPLQTQEPQEPQNPEEAQGTENPQEPQDPQETQQPEVPQGTEMPQVPQDLQTPEKPQESQNPEEPQGTENPQESLKPQDSQTPEEPQESQNPEVPQETENPQGLQDSQPEVPQEPEQLLDFSNQSGSNQSGSNQEPTN